jgi:hypothetical protein
LLKLIARQTELHKSPRPLILHGPVADGRFRLAKFCWPNFGLADRPCSVSTSDPRSSKSPRGLN